jgi:HAD superfamily hydrolase (TIGR01509 family)
MQFSETRAFIFDMDGVLVDSENLYKIIEKELFDEVGVQIDHEEHIAYQGCSNPVMWGLIKQKHKLPHTLDDLVVMTEDKVIRYFNSLAVIEPMPEVSDLLQLLKTKGFKLALASSSTIEVIRIILAKTGLGHYFDAVADSTEAGTGKPDPAIFLLAQKKLGIPKESCIVIEDSTNGIKAALSAGIYCIAFNGPGSEHQDQSAADWRITRFSEITEKFNLKENQSN